MDFKNPRISERLVQPDEPSSEYDLDENLNQPCFVYKLTPVISKHRNGSAAPLTASFNAPQLSQLVTCANDND